MSQKLTAGTYQNRESISLLLLLRLLLKGEQQKNAQLALDIHLDEAISG